MEFIKKGDRLTIEWENGDTTQDIASGNEYKVNMLSGGKIIGTTKCVPLTKDYWCYKTFIKSKNK